MALVSILAALILAPRLLTLNTFQTADEPRWQANIHGFTDHLAHLELKNLLQQPHPGLTTQWLAAPTSHLSFGHDGKVSLIIAQSLLLLITFYVYQLLWGKQAGALVAILLAINPVLIAHTRVLAMDSLLAHFLVLALGSLLLWQQRTQNRYLIFSAAFAAASWLSKLPGILILPYSLALIALHHWRHNQPRRIFRGSILWLSSFILTSILILPTLILSPFTVYDAIRDFFISPDYTELHSTSSWYYLRTLIFFTTPLHFSLIVLLPLAWRKFSPAKKQQAITLLFFAVLFIGVMTVGSKYGDRYILPSIVILDLIAALSLAALLRSTRPAQRLASITALILIVWQIALLPRLHPYYLAYVNPLTKPLFAERRLGWGEGLDKAARYLNQLPNAKQLTVASYYPNQIRPYFSGSVTDLHNWDNGNIDYAIIYRAALERGDDAWETDVIEQVSKKKLERLITINGLEYIWIYNLSSDNPLPATQ